MKLILIFISIFGTVTSQRSQFVDYVLDLQYAVGFIHDYVQDTTWNSRDSMSVELSKISQFSVDEISKGLSNLISIRDETEAAIEAVRGIGDEDCIDGVVSTWQEQLRLVGATIQTCGNSHMSSLYNNTVGFHEFINENRQMKFDAQNIVIQTFTELNALTDFMDLSPTVERNINEIYEEFEDSIHPDLRDRVQIFENLAEEIPSETETCVADAIQSLTMDAESTTRQVQAC